MFYKTLKKIMNIYKKITLGLITATSIFSLSSESVLAETFTVTVDDSWEPMDYVNEIASHEEYDTVKFITVDGTEKQMDISIFEAADEIREKNKKDNIEYLDGEEYQEPEEEISEEIKIDIGGEEKTDETEILEDSDALITDGREYFWVVFQGNLKKGTQMSADNFVSANVKKSNTNEIFKIVLNKENGFKTAMQLPSGKYTVTCEINGDLESGDFVSCKNSSFEVKDNETEIEFEILGGSLATETTEAEEELLDDENNTENTVKKENFWLKLLKNNAIFILILIGLSVALMVYRLKQDNM